MAILLRNLSNHAADDDDDGDESDTSMPPLEEVPPSMLEMPPAPLSAQASQGAPDRFTTSGPVNGALSARIPARHSITSSNLNQPTPTPNSQTTLSTHAHPADYGVPLRYLYLFQGRNLALYATPQSHRPTASHVNGDSQPDTPGTTRSPPSHEQGDAPPEDSLSTRPIENPRTSPTVSPLDPVHPFVGDS